MSRKSFAYHPYFLIEQEQLKTISLNKMMVKHISQKLGIQIHYSEISYFLYVYRRGGSAMTSREPDQQEGFGL